jgi:hypothetical protein
MRMASKDDNKCKYAADDAEEEVKEAPPKKPKTIGGSDDNGDDHNNDGNDSDDHDDKGDDGEDSSSSSSSTDDDYSLELEEEVSSKEEINIPIGSKGKLLIRRGRFDDGDTSDDQEESRRYFSNDY